MDSNKIKNRVIDWLTFEPIEKYDLSPSLERLTGKIKDLVKFKKKLFKNANYIFDHLKQKGISVIFVDDIKKYPPLDYNWSIQTFNRKEISLFFTGEMNKSIKLKNKLYYYSNREYFDVYTPRNNDPAAFKLDRAIISEFSGINENNIHGSTLYTSRPKIYFDYLTNYFKIQFTLLTIELSKESLEEYNKSIKSTKGFIDTYLPVSEEDEENDVEAEVNVKEGLEIIRKLNYDALEVKNITTHRSPVFKADTWCRPIETMTEELSQSVCETPNPDKEEYFKELTGGSTFA